MPVFKALYSTLPGCFPESRVGCQLAMPRPRVFIQQGSGDVDCWVLRVQPSSACVHMPASMGTCILPVKSHLYLISYPCQKEGASTG